MFEESLLLIVPEKRHAATRRVIDDSKNLLKRYFIGVFLEVLGVMSLIAIGLWIFGVKNALLIGFFGGIMNIIPYLGPVIGSVIGVSLGITGTLAFGSVNELWPVIFKLAGLPGMLLAVPVYTLLRVIAKEFFNQFRVVKKPTETMND